LARGYIFHALHWFLFFCHCGRPRAGARARAVRPGARRPPTQHSGSKPLFLTGQKFWVRGVVSTRWNTFLVYTVRPDALPSAFEEDCTASRRHECRSMCTYAHQGGPRTAENLVVLCVACYTKSKSVPVRCRSSMRGRLTRCKGRRIDQHRRLECRTCEYDWQ